MDVKAEPVLILPTGGPPQPREGTKAGVMFVTEHPRLVRARVKPTTKCCRGARPNDSDRPSTFKKDVKIVGTNSTSHLESTRVSKKRTQNGGESKPKTCCEYAKVPKQPGLQRVRRQLPCPSLRTDTMSSPTPSHHKVAILNLNERSWNVYENKGPLRKTRGQSWNLHENKGDILISWDVIENT